MVQGKVYKRGELLIIDADLVNAATGEELWRSRYRRQISDALDLEQEISGDLTRKLQESPKSEQPEHFPRRTTTNREAYHTTSRACMKCGSYRVTPRDQP